MLGGGHQRDYSTGDWEWPGPGKMQGWSRAEHGALALPTSKTFWNCPGCEPAASGRGSYPCFRTHLGTLDSLKALEEEGKAGQKGHQDGSRPPGQALLQWPHRLAGHSLAPVALTSVASQAQTWALPSLSDVPPPPWGILSSPGPEPTTLFASQLLQAKHSYHGAWGTRGAWRPWFHYDLGLGRVRGGLVTHRPVIPHSPTLEFIGHWRSTAWVWAPSSLLPPGGLCLVGGPVLAFGFKDRPQAPPPPPSLPWAWSGQVALVSQGSGPQPALSRDHQQPPYQALL